MLCLGSARSGNDADNGVAKLLDETSIQYTGKPIDEIGFLMKLDGTDTGIYKLFDMKDDEG